MTIPEVRSALLLIATELEEDAKQIRTEGIVLQHLPLKDRADKISDKVRAIGALEVQMWRRPPIRVAPPKARQMDPQVKAEILHLFNTYKDMSQQCIAEIVGVTSGRVSETVRGKRR
jgi:hypothetical protein